ncbi:uncharacterized protein LOC124926786 [Impatiens glandulifera]|uniref:uncharacterized protein LOC124926786 n=1 Tax=Impatiens glandulifera TaxID=253017 RepID=UPI001FB06077|nr:uncharacterized protein LOC124926786 [Impatiens glandulifera]
MPFVSMVELEQESSGADPTENSTDTSLPCDGEFEDQEPETASHKRRRKKTRGGGVLSNSNELVAQDPLAVFGSDIMAAMLSRLDARSVALSLLVSRRWYAVAASDRLWTSKCEELLLGKAHIPRSSQNSSFSKLVSYSLSVMDGKRTRIMKEDLCDHVWELHFKEEAPEYWRNLDPYWKGTGSPMKRYFHPDGSLSADPRDPVWGGHESCYSIVTSFVGEGIIREHYVRINRWPRMRVLRMLDWSWEMSNNIYCYRSVPDAEKGGTGPPFPV